MRRIAIAAFMAACIALPTKGFALGCEDKNAPNDRDQLVSDYTKVANRKIDVAKVTAAAQALAGQGTFVRVRVFDTLEGKPSIEDLAEKWQRQCGWQSSDGKLPSTAIFIPFAVEKGDIMIKTGTAINSRITEAVTQKAIATIMTPSWQSYKRDPNALTNGLVSTLDSFRVVLAQPLVSPGGGGNTTVIHQAPAQPTDLSGLWKVLGVIVIIGGIVIGVFVYLRVSQDRGEGQSAQGQAKIARQKCLRRLIAITDSSSLATKEAMIDAKLSQLPEGKATELQQLFVTFKKQCETATAEFERFDSVDGEDPNAKGLSPDAYRSNEQAYEDILAGSIELAEETSRKISELLNSASSARVA